MNNQIFHQSEEDNSMFLLPFTGVEGVVTCGADAGTAAAATSAHTTALGQWETSWNWYPDAPGAYPAPKWSWYNSSGGLYDQAHAPVSTASTDGSTAVAGASTGTHTTALGQWETSYNWYPDTPGSYPASKWSWYGSPTPDSRWAWYTAQQNQLAVLPPTSTNLKGRALPALPEDDIFEAPEKCSEQGANDTSTKSRKPTPASPGHLVMCGHACLLGAIEATGKLLTREDAKGWLEDWRSEFARASTAAAESSSPVGGYVMREHIMA